MCDTCMPWVLNAHAKSPDSLNLDSWHFSLSCSLSRAIGPVLVLAGDQAQMARFAKHLPVQRIAAVLIWFRRELDDADLQTIWKTYWLVKINVCLCDCRLVSVTLQFTVCPQNAYLTSVAVLVVGASQTFNIIAVSTIFFWNDQLVAGVTLWSIFSLWTF